MTFDLADEALWLRWEALRAVGVATPFQSAAFARPMLTRLAPAFGRRPFVVEIHDVAGRHVLSLGLCVGRNRLARHVEFADFGLCDMNAPIFRRDLDPAAGDGLRAALLAALPNHDALVLAKMPSVIDGEANPLAGWPGVRPMNVATMVYDPALKPLAEVSAFKEFSRKRRKLIREGGAVRRVEDTGRAAAVLDFAFALRSEQAEREGRRETIARSDVRDFYHEVIRVGLADGSVTIWEATLGDRIIAMILGLKGAGRFNGTLMASDRDPQLHVYSPGQITVVGVLEEHVASAGGLFDLGPGQQTYKARFGGQPAELVEYRRLASPFGLAAIADRRLREAVRGVLRRNPSVGARLRPIIERLNANP